ncbi:MAG: hypothetical protein HYT39_00865 [Candidatus Sungbacteria bacterium]|nr:hypothetical protein [Candidatus Sungbacteria bacterium]
MQIVLAILYVLAGVLLAIPYCLLAGWNAESFPMVAFVAPAFLFIWFMTATFAGVVEPGHRRTIHFNWRAAFGKSDRRVLSGSLPFFWAWTLYSFLPVILHWSAVLLGKIGYETVASLIDMHRYASPLYFFMATLMLLILIGMVTSAWDAAKNVWTRIVHR